MPYTDLLTRYASLLASGAYRAPQPTNNKMNTPETTPSTEEPPIDKDLKITQLKWLLDIKDGEIIHLHSQMAKALTDKEEAVHAASEARAMASNLISRETVELLRADKARDEAFESASDKDDEIALLKSNLAKAVAENDAARNERDRVWAAAVSIGSANAKLLTENSALKASNAELMSGVDKALESEELAISRGKEHLAHAESAKVEAERQRDCALDRVPPLIAVRDRLAKERDEARAMVANLISRETVELLREDKARDEAFELASDNDDEIALLKSHLAKTVAEMDQLHKDMEQQLIPLREVRSVNTKLLTENSALKASGWRQFKDQKPTMDDSDAKGCVMMCGTDGALAITRVCAAHQFDAAWWRPTMSPVVFTPFHQWVKALAPDERSRFNCNGNLRSIWESIEKFNQNH